ncbi:VPLPA-CTERM sorting domain-containing protein [Roseovarius spongiae]|uniref:VPLPA-CTERM sorting domain-containing protein n=1 Tax=Roseovarius spongiae TaxID=2320272 RepID=A0A3A8B4F5_9RHOB|nr:VPLPA-CTERM sorting domain-containing protein [Roseovarius spongiae]RKF16541.1 VPLPA-CTERM sorting domain-containing protein [Roseovarius spongiae]
MMEWYRVCKGEVMKRLSFAAALAGALFVSGAASASTLIYDQTLIPNSSSNSTTFFDDDNDFSESWDFSGVAYTAIDRFELTLEVSGAADESGWFFGHPKEDWKIRVQGSQSGPSSNPVNVNDDLFDDIADGTNTYTINAASDAGSVDVFAHSVATGNFTLWLAEETSDVLLPNPSITVSSANLKVYGDVAPVPLPAGAPLLLAGLGGLALLRRRRKAAPKA